MNSEYDSTNLSLKLNVNGDGVDDLQLDIASSLHVVNSRFCSENSHDYFI
jgi:hypothetical protein